VPDSYEHEVRVAGSSGQGQNLVFLSFQGHNVGFFDISRRSVYVLVRSLRSLRVGGVARLFNEISVFFGFWYFFHFSSIFWVILVSFGFLSCKKTVFGHFIRFRPF
jgi:hypothetical protein